MGTQCVCVSSVRLRWKKKEDVRESFFSRCVWSHKKSPAKPCWVVLVTASVIASFQWTSSLTVHGKDSSDKFPNDWNGHLAPVVIYQCASTEGLVLECSYKLPFSVLELHLLALSENLTHRVLWVNYAWDMLSLTVPRPCMGADTQSGMHFLLGQCSEGSHLLLSLLPTGHWAPRTAGLTSAVYTGESVCGPFAQLHVETTASSLGTWTACTFAPASLCWSVTAPGGHGQWTGSSATSHPVKMVRF